MSAFDLWRICRERMVVYSLGLDPSLDKLPCIFIETDVAGNVDQPFSDESLGGAGQWGWSSGGFYFDDGIHVCGYFWRGLWLRGWIFYM